MTENNESRLWTIARTAVKCVSLALRVTFSGLMAVIVVIGLLHAYETHPRSYALSIGAVAIGSFVLMTIRLTKGNDDGKEGLA